MTHNLSSRDLARIWHPYTQMKDCEDLAPIPIKRAKGMKLFGYNGDFYYDTISSWWCNVHGHGHPIIKRAIKKQVDQLEHILFAGFTHEPAVKLAEKLVEIAPKGLERVFYSDNGSTAVEVALKMSLQYWQNIGRPEKEHFISLDMGYHGDTVGAMSVSGVDLYNKRFKNLFFKSFKATTPYCYRCPKGMEKGDCSLECLSAMEDIFKKHSRTIAAVIIEPILMGAGGMIVYPSAYLKGVSRLAKKYGVHLIADEVATGFGRTGKMFACELAGVSPDMMCVSKGITSGYLPLAATLVTEKIFKAFYADYHKHKTFFHGHTYTANPVACAAALGSFEVFEKERSLDRVPAINQKLSAFLKEMSKLNIVGDTRHIGVVGAMELVSDKPTKSPFPPKTRIGREIYKQGLKNHLLLRPLGDIVYFFLPLSAKDHELDYIFTKTKQILRQF